MEVTTLLYFLAVLITYIFGAVVASFIPASIFLFFYRRKMEEHRKNTGLDPYAVPIRLRHLLPVVKKWAIENDIERVNTYKEASSHDRFALSKSIAGKTEVINQWLTTFGNRPLTPEAKSFYLVLKLTEETGTVIEPFSDSTNLLSMNSLDQVNVSPQSIYYGKARIVKVPSVVRMVLGLILFIIYFIVFGKVWAFFSPGTSSAVGLIAVSFLSGLATISTGSFVVASIRLLSKGKLELKL